MAQKKKPGSGKRVALKVIMIVFCCLSVLSVAAVIGYNVVLDYYVGMINVVEGTDNSEIYATTDILDTDVDTDVTESPSDVISDVQQELKNNLANVDGLPAIQDSRYVTNILLVGIDARKAGEYCRSDSMMLVSINTQLKKIVACSLLRDMCVDVEKRGLCKLNASYAYGGVNLLKSTLKRNFNIDVNYYMTVDFYSFIDIVDIMGGIDVDLTAKEAHYVNFYLWEINDLLGRKFGTEYISEKKGSYHLTGPQTLAYSRIRYVSNESGSGDFARTGRQREVLNILSQKAKDMSLSQLLELLGVILPKITTNMPTTTLKTLVSNIPAYLSFDIQMTSIPHNGWYSDIWIGKSQMLSVNFKKNCNYLYDLIYKKDTVA